MKYILNVLFFYAFGIQAQYVNTESLKFTLPNGHNAPILNTIYSSKNQRVISASWDNKIKVWDERSFKELLTFEKHQDLILSVAITNDETKVLSADIEGNLYFWEVVSGEVLYQLTNVGWISSMHSIPQSKSIFLSCENGYLLEFNTIQMTIVDSIKVAGIDDGRVTTKYCPNKAILILHSEFNKNISVYNVETKKVSKYDLLSNDVNNFIYDEYNDNLIILYNSSEFEQISFNERTSKRISSLTHEDLNGFFIDANNKIITYNKKGEILTVDASFKIVERKKISDLPIVFISPLKDENKICVLAEASDYNRIQGEIPTKTGTLKVIALPQYSTEFEASFYQPFSSVEINEDRTKLLAGSDDYYILHFDLKKFSLNYFEGKTEYFSEGKVVVDDWLLLEDQLSEGLVYYNGEFCSMTHDLDGVCILRGQKSKNIYRKTFFNNDSKFIDYFKVSKDSTLLFTIANNDEDQNILQIFRADTGERIASLKPDKPNEFIDAVFSSNCDDLYINNQNEILKYGIKSKELLKVIIPEKNVFINSFDVCKNDKYLAVAHNNFLLIYNMNFKLLYKYKVESVIDDVKFSSSGNFLSVSSDDGILYLLRFPFDSIYSQIKIFNGRILGFHFSTHEDFISVQGNDENLLKVVDIKNNKIIFEKSTFYQNKWLVKLPSSPYYMCSREASKMLHYVTPGLKVIGFEQLDPVYNRPDIVLDSIGKYFGGADQELIANYRESWEKRIRRLGLDQEKLGKGEIAVPNAEIVNADDIAYENEAGILEIKVDANDAGYNLRRFNVYINEVPLYGSAGISIAHLKTQVWDTTVTIALSMGENKIQVSVMNELGLENFKYPTYVNYTPVQTIAAKTHYIGIGVNVFNEDGHNLKYCVKDVRDLAKALSAENTNTDTLIFTDRQVTRENILSLKDYLKGTNVNDKVIISCSSHGLLDDSLNFYLAMHDVDFGNPGERGLRYEELEDLLDAIPARKKLLLLDACNSGENDRTEVLEKELEQKQQTLNSDQLLAARGPINAVREANKETFKKMSELFVNVRNNTGSVIIAAAGGEESALEAVEVDGKTIENGAFTHSILECMRKNRGTELTVNTLKQYAEKRVEEITGGKQKPTSRQETMEVDWSVK